ncbi:MAG: hypothetical protein KAH46_20410 [Mycobacterium sp.]|nr:hypothetical protein [Mycobacterium sp.]
MYGLLTIASLAAVAVFGTIAFGYVARLRRRPPLADGDEIGQATRVLKNVRKGEPLTDAESAKARRVIADRRSVWAYSMPAGLISIGCFFVFGSLEQLHGATPSERTFLGIFPMLTGTNLAVQLFRSARLKKRVPAAAPPPPPPDPVYADTSG